MSGQKYSNKVERVDFIRKTFFCPDCFLALQGYIMGLNKEREKPYSLPCSALFLKKNY